jgi:hypothetical protein
MAKTKRKLPVERAAPVSTMARTSGQDSLSKSVPNLNQMWGKLVMMGAGRSSLLAIMVEITDTSTTKMMSIASHIDEDVKVVTNL